MSRKFLAAALAATAILGIAPIGAAQATPAPAQDSAQPAKQCFSVSRIANWAKADDKIVYVRVEGGAVFQITLAGQCLKPARTGVNTLSFATNMSDDVCDPMDLTVIVATSLAPLRCPVNGLRRLTPEEVAALPAGSKP